MCLWRSPWAPRAQGVGLSNPDAIPWATGAGRVFGEGWRCAVCVRKQCVGGVGWQGEGQDPGRYCSGLWHQQMSLQASWRWDAGH